MPVGAVFDRDVHQLGAAFAVEASREVPAAGGIRFTDDLDCPHRLLARRFATGRVI
jgi:hypothetical protein